MGSFKIIILYKRQDYLKMIGGWSMYCALLILLLFYSCQQKSTKSLHPNPILENSNPLFPTGIPIKLEGRVSPNDKSVQAHLVKAQIDTVSELKQAHKLQTSIKKIAFHLALSTPGQNGLDPPKRVSVTKRILPLKQSPAIPLLAWKTRDNGVIRYPYIDVTEGLPSSYIRTLFMDSKGYVWISCYGKGLSRFDGKMFTNYTEKEGLLSKDIKRIIEDKKGNIWLVSEIGLCKFDGKTFAYYDESTGFLNNPINDICFDSKGDIWIAARAGLGHLSDSTLTFYTAQSGLTDSLLRFVLCDKEDNIWMGTDKGLYKFDGTSFTYYSVIAKKKAGFYAGAIDPKGTIWLGSRLKNGIYSFDKDAGLTQFSLPQLNEENHIPSITTDSKGNVYFASWGNGLIVFDGKDFIQHNQKQGLPNDYLLSAMVDYKNQVWLGTDGTGICRYMPNHFFNFTSTDGLKVEVISSIMEGNNNELWFGLEVEGLHRLEGKRLTHYSTKGGQLENPIYCLAKDKRGKLWLGTHTGISYFDGKIFHKYKTQSFNTISALCLDKKGLLWMGSKYDGIATFDGTQFRHWTKKKNQFLNDNIRHIVEDSKGNIWIATEGGGVAKFDGEAFTFYTTREGLPNNNVNSIMEDKEGYLWFGTFGGGLSRYDGTSFSTINEENGLSNNNVWSLKEDNEARIWVATDWGLSMLAPYKEDTETKYAIHHFNESSGLKSLDFLPNSVYLDKNNRMWWGGGKALTMLDLNNLSFSNSIPQAQLTRIQVQEKFVDFNRLQDSTYLHSLAIPNIEYLASMNNRPAEPFFNYVPQLQLPYNINHLAFYFDNIHSDILQKTQYRYKMEGFDENWSEPTEDTRAEYRNIPPGKYIFRIVAINEKGQEGKSFDYSFSVFAPWYWTIWARIFYLLAIIGLVIGIFKFRTHQYKINQIKLENLVNQRTQQITNQNKVIEQAKKELEYLNADLEKKVAERTMQLEKTHEKTLNIIQANSHSLRNHVARILGLLVLYQDKLASEEFIMKNIDLSAKELDASLFEINKNLYSNTYLEEDNENKTEMP